MLRSVSIGKRILLLLALMIVFILAASAAFLNNANKIKNIGIEEARLAMLEGQKDKLKIATDSLATALGRLVAEERSTRARINVIRKAINDIRYEEDKSGYYFVFEETMTIAHAAKPSLNGKDLGALKDKNGVYMIRELSKTAADGGGFVEYIWPKPEQGDQPKLSYATMIPGTNYSIGTGVYIDNVEAKERTLTAHISDIVKKDTITIVASLGVVLVFLILPLSLFIIRSITLPLTEATTAAESISHGEYDVELEARGRDEAAILQQSLNSMAHTLRENIRDISAKTAEAEEKARAAEQAKHDADTARAEAEQARKDGIRMASERIQAVVDRVLAASSQISSQARVIDEGTTVQRDRIQGTATAMEEMNATVLEVARNASEASTAGAEARNQATEGAETVRRSVEAMNTTYEAADSLKTGMNKLGDQTEEIGTVLNVITDIADQTNLLALNAAIEAARAGEAGRGFAVVADEVRKLAEKTMQATKEVGDSISAVQGVARQNISGMEQALKDLSTAVTLSNQSGEVLGSIVDGAEQSALQIQSIATAAEEQSAASEEINQAIEEINSISLETSQGVAQSADALQELSSQMNELQEVINKLMLDAEA